MKRHKVVAWARRSTLFIASRPGGYHRLGGITVDPELFAAAEPYRGRKASAALFSQISQPPIPTAGCVSHGFSPRRSSCGVPERQGVAAAKMCPGSTINKVEAAASCEQCELFASYFLDRSGDLLIQFGGWWSKNAGSVHGGRNPQEREPDQGRRDPLQEEVVQRRDRPNIGPVGLPLPAARVCDGHADCHRQAVLMGTPPPRN